MKWRRSSSAWIAAFLSVWFWRHWWTITDRDDPNEVHGICGCGGSFTIRYRGRGRGSGVMSSSCPAGEARMWMIRRDRPALPVARVISR